MNFFQRVFQSAYAMSDKQQAKTAQRRQQYQQRFQTAYEKLTGVPPDLQPRGKQGKYFLEKHILHKGKQGITVHLHGHREDKKHNKRIEYIPLNYLPDGSLLTDIDILRCAAFLSPHEWVIPWGDNIQIFGGKWNGPLDPRLQPALTDPNRISSSNG
jgi:hypothetical protein